MNYQKGFSLIETMIGILLSILLVFIAGSLISNVVVQAKFQAEHTIRNKDIKTSTFSLSNEILNAGNGFFLANKFICPYGLIANNSTGVSTLLNIYPVITTPDTATTPLGFTSDKVQITSIYTKDLLPPYRMINNITNPPQDITLNKVEHLNVGDKLLIGNSNQKMPCVLLTITSIDTSNNSITYTAPNLASFSAFNFNFKEGSFVYNMSYGQNNKDALQSWVYFIDPSTKELKYYEQLSSDVQHAHILLSNVYAFIAYYNRDITIHTYNSAESTWYKQESGPLNFNNIPANTATNLLPPYNKTKVKGFKFFVLKRSDKKNTECNLNNNIIPLMKESDLSSTMLTLDLSTLNSDWKCWNYSLMQAENPLINGVLNE